MLCCMGKIEQFGNQGKNIHMMWSISYVLYEPYDIELHMYIQGCQFEVNADDENISPVDNSEISIDAENPWENFILSFPEDVSSLSLD